jgi:hypothetical protein
MSEHTDTANTTIVPETAREDAEGYEFDLMVGVDHISDAELRKMTLPAVMAFIESTNMPHEQARDLMFRAVRLDL